MASLTSNQQRVFEVLQEAEAPLGAYEILKHTGFRGAVQVYRALKVLSNLGLARKLESLNAYIACSSVSPFSPTAIAICDQCGLIHEVADASEIKQLQQKLARSHFQVSRTVVEFHGVCSACSESSQTDQQTPTAAKPKKD